MTSRFPHDLVAEEGVLARILEGDTSPLDKLNEQHFHSSGNAAVFTAALAARELGKPADIDSIALVLRARRVYYLQSIAVREYLLEVVGNHEWGSCTERYVTRVLAAWRAREVARALERALAEICAGSSPRGVVADLGHAFRRILFEAASPVRRAA